MSAAPKPKAHHLTVHTATGSHRCQVEAVHKLRDGIATVTIRAGDWLDLGTYAATYAAGDQRASGSYAVYDCRSSTEPMVFVDTFMREGSRWT